MCTYIAALKLSLEQLILIRYHRIQNMRTTPCTEEILHVRTSYAFNLAPRCGAKTRSGLPCKSPAMRSSIRCRMHGGINSGAPKGNQNAFKHGAFKSETKLQIKLVRDRILQFRELLKIVR